MSRMPLFLLVLACASAVPSYAQIQSARGVGSSRVHAVPQPAHNPAASDTTPLNCSRPEVRYHPHPGVSLLCKRWEDRLLQDSAKRSGRPAPSSSVVVLPALGTPDAKRTGFSCVGGQAFQRIDNGWVQVMAPGGGWQRCEGG